MERTWIVVRSDRHAKKQQTGFFKAFGAAEKAVKSTPPKARKSGDWERRLNKILEEQGLINSHVCVQETTRTQKHYYAGTGHGANP